MERCFGRVWYQESSLQHQENVEKTHWMRYNCHTPPRQTNSMQMSSCAQVLSSHNLNSVVRAAALALENQHKRKGAVTCYGGWFPHSQLTLEPSRIIRPENCRPRLPSRPTIQEPAGVNSVDFEVRSLCDGGLLEKAVNVLLLSGLDQQRSGPSVQTYGCVLQSCIKRKALGDVKRVQMHVVRNGLEQNTVLAEYIVNALLKCGSFSDGLQLFEKLEQRTVFGWTAVISAHTNVGRVQDALELYKQMQEDGVSPNRHTFLSLLRACSNLEQGKQIHADILQHKLQDDLFVGTTLLDMYARCGSMPSALHIFDVLSERDVVSWNAIIAGYAQQGEGEQALAMYERMQHECVVPDERTFVGLLKACGKVAAAEIRTPISGQSVKAAALKQGKALHAEITRMGYDSNVYITNSLVYVYATSGSIGDARQVFSKLRQSNVVSWNALLAAYAQQEECDAASRVYQEMQLEGVAPDSRTFVSMLQVCSSLATLEESVLLHGQTFKMGSLQIGKALHAEAVRRGCDSDIFVANSLTHMYASCGSAVDAQDIFDRLSQADVFSWNAILSAYSHEDQGEKALKLYARMQKEGVTPNEATFLWVLRACSDVGALKTTVQVHSDAVSCGYDCSSNVASALIHAYGRCGSMYRAQRVFDSLSRRDLVIWNALIAAFARGGDCEMTFRYFYRMKESGLKPDGFTFVSVLSACSHAGMVHEGVTYFSSMTTDYGIVAELRHFSAMIDLFGRAAFFRQAEDLILRMPMEPPLAMWLSLLGACRQHTNVEFGRRAFDAAVLLDPEHGAAYLLMSNIYAHAGMWDEAKKIDRLRRQLRAWNKPGKSWIEWDQQVYEFRVEDLKEEGSEELQDWLRDLVSQIENAPSSQNQ